MRAGRSFPFNRFYRGTVLAQSLPELTKINATATVQSPSISTVANPNAISAVATIQVEILETLNTGGVLASAVVFTPDCINTAKPNDIQVLASTSSPIISASATANPTTIQAVNIDQSPVVSDVTSAGTIAVSVSVFNPSIIETTQTNTILATASISTPDIHTANILPTSTINGSAIVYTPDLLTNAVVPQIIAVVAMPNAAIQSSSTVTHSVISCIGTVMTPRVYEKRFYIGDYEETRPSIIDGRTRDPEIGREIRPTINSGLIKSSEIRFSLTNILPPPTSEDHKVHIRARKENLSDVGSLSIMLYQGTRLIQSWESLALTDTFETLDFDVDNAYLITDYSSLELVLLALTPYTMTVQISWIVLEVPVYNGGEYYTIRRSTVAELDARPWRN